MAEDFPIAVTIDSSGAAEGASEIRSFLKSIEAASLRTAQIMEQRLAVETRDRIINAQRAQAREAGNAARAWQREIDKAARASSASVKKAAAEQRAALKETEKSAFSLRNAMIAAGAGTLARSVISTIASYEGLKTSLITVEKSQEAANAAFSRLQSFTDKTPFTVEQATKAWIRLRAA